MNILVIDDDKPKLDEIVNFINNQYSVTISEKGSYQSGLKAIMTKPFDLVLLDMNMRTYDPSESDPTGGRPRHFAGLEILQQIKRKQINLKVIVVTQFPFFGTGNDSKTLDELITTLKSEYSDYYLDTVYYKYSEDSWMKKLKENIDQFTIGGEK